MPLFYTPKPRQFKYRPRFYDPEKERWEALKMKYAIEHMDETELPKASEAPEKHENSNDVDLAYFQQRVREFDSEEKREKRGLTWKDLFRKREMPTFNYQPRFSSEEPKVESGEQGTGEHIAAFKKRNVKIKRRFDISDTDYMKPVPATRILLYVALVCMLLYWILF